MTYKQLEKKQKTQWLKQHRSEYYYCQGNHKYIHSEIIFSDMYNQDLASIESDDHLDIIHNAENNIHRTIINSALSKLRPRYYAIVKMFMYGYTQREISQFMGVSSSRIFEMLHQSFGQLYEDINIRKIIK